MPPDAAAARSRSCRRRACRSAGRRAASRPRAMRTPCRARWSARRTARRPPARRAPPAPCPPTRASSTAGDGGASAASAACRRRPARRAERNRACPEGGWRERPWSWMKSESDAEREIWPHAFITDAVGEIDVHPPERAAPTRAETEAREENVFAPGVGGRADVEERRRAPVAVEPVLVFAGCGDEIFGRQDRAADIVTDALEAVAAHRVRTARAEQQRGRHAARRAAREHAAQFRPKPHEVALSDRQSLLV